MKKVYLIINLDGPQRVKEYKKGDFFGELALIKNEPRAASVIAEVSFLY
jgi:CRP-like cAMP-binding protein